MANRESRSSWKDFLLGLRRRGLNGVEFVVADDHAGLRVAIREVLPEAAFQRCYVHFLRNALDHLPRKADDDCLQELRWLYDRRSVEEARCDLAAWITKWAPGVGSSFSGLRLATAPSRVSSCDRSITRKCGSIDTRSSSIGSTVIPSVSACRIAATTAASTAGSSRFPHCRRNPMRGFSRSRAVAAGRLP